MSFYLFLFRLDIHYSASGTLEHCRSRLFFIYEKCTYSDLWNTDMNINYKELALELNLYEIIKVYLIFIVT